MTKPSASSLTHLFILSILWVTCLAVPGCCQGVGTGFPITPHDRGLKSKGPSLLKQVSQQPFTRALLAGAVATNIARHWDTEAGPRVRASNMAEFDGIDVGDVYGDGATLTGLSLVTWGVGAIGKRDHLRETGWMMMKGLILDGLMVNAVKVGVARTRPDGSDSRSFPSGHTSSAFTVSTILARRYGWKMAIPAYTLATTTAIARMEDNRHYLSDVVAGAALGVAIGELITGGQSAHSRLQVTTTASTVGLKLRF